MEPISIIMAALAAGVQVGAERASGTGTISTRRSGSPNSPSGSSWVKSTNARTSHSRSARTTCEVSAA